MNIRFYYSFYDTNIYIYIYKVNKDSEYPNIECSMHDYLIQNILAEQIYIFG